MFFFSSVISPILPVMMTEVGEHFQDTHPLPMRCHHLLDSWKDETLARKFHQVLVLKEEILRQAALEGHPDLRQLEVDLFTPNMEISTALALKEFDTRASLCELFQSPSIQILDGSTSKDSFFLRGTSMKLCPRCRLYASHSPEKLCLRCEKVIGN